MRLLTVWLQFSHPQNTSHQSRCSGLGTGPGATVGGVEGIRGVVSNGGARLEQFWRRLGRQSVHDQPDL